MTISTMCFPGLNQNGFEVGIVSPETDNLARGRKGLPALAEKQVLTWRQIKEEEGGEVPRELDYFS